MRWSHSIVQGVVSNNYQKNMCQGLHKKQTNQLRTSPPLPEYTTYNTHMQEG